MATVIDVNGQFEVILSEDDFAYIVEKHMGPEAADYYKEILSKRDYYRERVGETYDE